MKRENAQSTRVEKHKIIKIGKTNCNTDILGAKYGQTVLQAARLIDGSLNI